MKGKNIIKRVLPIMLAVMVGLTFSFELTKADASALSKPGKVKSLTVKHDSTYPDAAYLKWKKVSNATGYKVYRSTKKTKGFKCIATIKGKSNTKFFDDSYDLSCDGKTWYYKVRAYKKKGSKTKYGKYSSVKSFKNPLIDIGFAVLEYGYDESDGYFMEVEAENFSSDPILLYDWVNVNYDSYDYIVAEYWNGEEYAPVSSEEDLIVDPYTSTIYRLIAESGVEEPFEYYDGDVFEWYFETAKQYLGGYDIFYGRWYEGYSDIYVQPDYGKSATKKDGSRNYKLNKF